MTHPLKPVNTRKKPSGIASERLLFRSATRIRTLKMTESESVALPFGDSAICRVTNGIIVQCRIKCKLFLENIF